LIFASKPYTYLAGYGRAGLKKKNGLVHGP